MGNSQARPGILSLVDRHIPDDQRQLEYDWIDEEVRVLIGFETLRQFLLTLEFLRQQA